MLLSALKILIFLAAVLVVAGDVTADEVRALAEKHYGPIHADPAAVLAFGQILVDADWLSKPEDVIYYFERPWKWSELHQIWAAAGMPDKNHTDAWDALVEAFDGLS